MTGKPRAYPVKNWAGFLHAIDHLRHQQGLSLRKLADRTGGTHQHLGRQLTGEVTALAPVAWALADALDHDIALIPRQPKEQP